jgi:hypothetical protein
MKRNVAGQTIGAQMISATDGSAFTGAVTIYVCGDAGTQAAGSVGAGACAHEGNGYHTYAPAQAETNYDLVAFTFIGTGAIPVTVQVVTDFPQTGDSFARIGVDGAGLAALTPPTAIENADALLKRDWAAVTGEAARSVLNALRAIRNKWSISGVTLTVTKEDDTAAAWTATVMSDSAAEPITGSDPT